VESGPQHNNVNVAQRPTTDHVHIGQKTPSPGSHYHYCRDRVIWRRRKKTDGGVFEGGSRGCVEKDISELATCSPRMGGL